MQWSFKKQVERWSENRNRKKLDRLISQHNLIMQSGIAVEAQINRIYEGDHIDSGWRIIRLQVTILFTDKTKAIFLTKTLAPHTPSLLEGRKAIIKLIAGNLSQVVLCF